MLHLVFSATCGSSWNKRELVDEWLTHQETLEWNDHSFSLSWFDDVQKKKKTGYFC